MNGGEEEEVGGMLSCDVQSVAHIGQIKTLVNKDERDGECGEKEATSGEFFTGTREK